MAIESSEEYAERFFKEQNVWVYVPAQKEPGELEIVQLVLTPEDLPEDSEEFKLKRPVINFEVKKDGSPLDVFDPRMELRVGLLQDEVEELRSGRKFKLAFCLEGGEKWVVFTQKKHDFRIDLEGRDAVAWISDWGDATVGFGR